MKSKKELSIAEIADSACKAGGGCSKHPQHKADKPMEHTPTPWQANSIFINNEPNRMMIKQKGWKGETIADLGLDNDISDANATFIVRAVNAHEELLEALKQLANVARDKNSLVKDSIIQNAWQAIARAKGR